MPSQGFCGSHVEEVVTVKLGFGFVYSQQLFFVNLNILDLLKCCVAELKESNFAC